MKSARIWAEVVLALAVAVFGYLYWQKLTEPAPVGVPIEAKPSALVKAIPTEKLECVPVIVYRDRAKEKLKLPPSVAEDPAKRVVDATEVKPDFRPHTVTTVLDTNTGKTTTYDTRMALPWLDINTNAHIGIGYGTSDVGRIVGVEAQRALVNIKAVAIVGKAEADFPLDGGSMRWKAMVYGQYRF